MPTSSQYELVCSFDNPMNRSEEGFVHSLRLLDFNDNRSALQVLQISFQMFFFLMLLSRERD